MPWIHIDKESGDQVHFYWMHLRTIYEIMSDYQEKKITLEEMNRKLKQYVKVNFELDYYTGYVYDFDDEKVEAFMNKIKKDKHMRKTVFSDPSNKLPSSNCVIL